MTEFRHATYTDNIPHNIHCILVGDIGGTNANFGFFKIEGTKAIFLFSLHAKSKTITNFAAVVADVLAYAQERYAIKVSQACFAAAGVVGEKRDYCKPTNLHFIICALEIRTATNLQCVYIVNDFEVIGYGLMHIDPKALVNVHRGIPYTRSNKAIIGAGTGLGKCIMTWNKTLNRSIPVASEGGHADFAAQNQTEYDLVQFIQKTENWHCTISWEDMLSGNGIKRLYAFFRNRDQSVAADENLVINGLHPDTIFKNRHRDAHAWNTFVLYTQIYARCAKNFALDALAMGGVYIAGGIAANNLPLFEQKEFAREFVNCGKQQALLATIPIFVITDYNVSLYGVAYYMITENLCGD